jgi:hypothetical protein
LKITNDSIFAGQIKTVITSVLGLFILGGVRATPALIIGLTVNTTGGALYALAKLRESKPIPASVDVKGKV